MKNEPSFEWNEELKMASCFLKDGQEVFVGFAQCHPEDMDMVTEKVGCEIAFYRAKIKFYQSLKKDLKTALYALNQLYYSMKHSKQFNENSYENHMLQRQIAIHETDLKTIKNLIKIEKEALYKYIDEKDKFYKKIRSNRKKANKE